MNDAAVDWLESVAYRQTVSGTSFTPEGFFSIKVDNEKHDGGIAACKICRPVADVALTIYPPLIAAHDIRSILRNLA
jgi:hypothetical protein